MINYDSQLYQALNLHLQDSRDEAKKIYEQILKADKDNACVYYLLAEIYNRNDQSEKAQEYLKKAIQINCNVDFVEDFSNIQEIIILLFMTIVEKENIYRIESWEKALTLKPVLESAYVNVSQSYLQANDISNAYRVCNEGLELYPDNHDLKLNKGAALLRSNNIEEGWHWHESRIQIFDHHKLRFSTDDKPKYDGTQDIRDKIIYVYCNAGFGDTIFFARYLPLLSEKCKKVIVKPQQALISLLKESDLKVEIIDNDIPDEIIEFDYQMPIMSLANAFKTSINTVPYVEGYLKAGQEKVKFYYDKYFNNDKFNVGIFWQSGGGCERNIPLDMFFKLTEIQNLQLYALQKGEGSEQLDNVPDSIKIIDLGSTFRDFSDTAAAVENLDLLIGCDTVMCNLAGAMGKPLWLLLQYCSDWKWGLIGESTKWYKSARLFRQKVPGNWDEVMQMVYRELNHYNQKKHLEKLCKI